MFELEWALTLVVAMLLPVSTTIVQTQLLVMLVVLWLGGEFFNKHLKRWTCSTFPKEKSFRRPHNSKQCGMPSGTVQIIAAIITFLLLILRKSGKLSPTTMTVGVGLVLLTMISRVTRGFHTVAQTMAGAVVGMAVAWVAFYVVYVPLLQK